MPFRDALTDKVTLVKADGNIYREGIPARVSSVEIITFEKDLPIQPNDHFIRLLPNGIAEDFIVVDPGFQAGFHGVPSHFQSKVRRSDVPAAPTQAVIQNISNSFHGANSRVNINSVDNSTNTSVSISTLQLAKLLEEVKPYLPNLPEPQRAEISATIKLLETEVRSGAPDQLKVRAGLQSIKAVAEGAAGNLVASGIGALVGSLLSGG